jgi:hypothetical protein
MVFDCEGTGQLDIQCKLPRLRTQAREIGHAIHDLRPIASGVVEYILSTFKGIQERRSLLTGGCSVAERIVQKFAEMSFPG